MKEICGGLLTVRTIADPEAPDPKVRLRNPVLITAVYSPGLRHRDVEPAEGEALLLAAEQMSRLAKTSGEKPRWTIPILPRLNHILKIRCRINRMKTILFALIVMILGLLAASVFLLGDKGQKDTSAWADAAFEKLDVWVDGLEKKSSDTSDGKWRLNTLNRLFLFLSRTGLDNASAGVDSEFMSRFLNSEELKQCQAWKDPARPDVAEVQHNMSILLKKLTGKEVDAGNEPKDVIRMLGEALSFFDWYTSDARKRVFTGMEEALDETDRSKIYKLLSGSPHGMGSNELYRELYGTLTDSWGLRGITKDDLDLRPWFIAGCFFEFLSQDAIRSAKDAKQKNVLVDFIRKDLPERSLLNGKSYRKDNFHFEVSTGLNGLMDKFELKAPKDPVECLKEIQKHLQKRAQFALEKATKQPAMLEAFPELTWYVRTLAGEKPKPPVRAEKGK